MSTACRVPQGSAGNTASPTARGPCQRVQMAGKKSLSGHLTEQGSCAQRWSPPHTPLPGPREHHRGRAPKPRRPAGPGSRTLCVRARAGKTRGQARLSPLPVGEATGWVERPLDPAGGRPPCSAARPTHGPRPRTDPRGGHVGPASGVLGAERPWQQTAHRGLTGPWVASSPPLRQPRVHPCLPLGPSSGQPRAPLLCTHRHSQSRPVCPLPRDLLATPARTGARNETKHIPQDPGRVTPPSAQLQSPVTPGTEAGQGCSRGEGSRTHQLPGGASSAGGSSHTAHRPSRGPKGSWQGLSWAAAVSCPLPTTW